MSTRNKIAVVTGASRGLGRSAAMKLAEDGIDLIVTYRVNAAEAAEVVDAVTAVGRTAVAFQLDTGAVESFDQFEADVRDVLKDRWDRDSFDYLVNNAGNGIFGGFGDVTVADFDAMVNVHFRGVFFLTQRLLPLIGDGGRIVNISTGLTRFVSDGTSAYSSVKGAVEVLTRNLAKELGPRGISVNTVAPGPIATDFNGGLMRDDDQMRAVLSSSTALGRVGEPGDVAGVVAALLTPGFGWVTGQRIEVSGGTLL